MADICTASVSPKSCGHYDVSATVVGDAIVVHLHDNDLLVPLTIAEKETLFLLTARVLRQTGVTPAQFVGRVLRGDEATNVKLYSLLGPGAVVTKTNIGSVYVNVCPGLNGERTLIDFTGCTQYRLILSANLIGTGAFGARIVRDSDDLVLHENANLGAAGERELDTNWQTLPGGFTTQTLVRLQMKSVTAADDPIVRRCAVLVR